MIRREKWCWMKRKRTARGGEKGGVGRGEKGVVE